MRIHHQIVTQLRSNDLEWVERRLGIYRSVTYASLQAQSVQDFTVWVNAHPLSYALVEAALGSLDNPAVHRCYGDIFEETTSALPECDWVYSTRLDSDDVYGPRAMAIVREHLPTGRHPAECLMFQRGYTHDLRSGDWGEYCCHSSPFHTIVYRYDCCRDYRSREVTEHRHGRVAEAYPTTLLPDWNFCVVRHGVNVTTDGFLSKNARPQKSVLGCHPYLGRPLEDFINGE